MAKDKKEKPVLTLNDKEYIIEDMTDEQKVMVQHINDLQNKQNTNAFISDQLQVGKEAFINMLSKSLEEKPEEVEVEV
jgi:predicted xylose isomerase-like sugar epimerase